VTMNEKKKKVRQVLFGVFVDHFGLKLIAAVVTGILWYMARIK